MSYKQEKNKREGGRERERERGERCHVPKKNATDKPGVNIASSSGRKKY
jgi:hypothetical protein